MEKYNLENYVTQCHSSRFRLVEGNGDSNVRYVVLCCVVLFCAVLCRVLLCCVVSSCTVPCRAVLCCVVSCRAVLCSVVCCRAV